MPTASHRQPLHSLYRRPQALRPASAYPPRQQQHNLGPSYNVATHEVRLHSSRCLSQHFLCRSSHLYLDLGAGHLQVRRWDVCNIIIISRSRTLFFNLVNIYYQWYCIILNGMVFTMGTVLFRPRWLFIFIGTVLFWMRVKKNILNCVKITNYSFIIINRYCIVYEHCIVLNRTISNYIYIFFINQSVVNINNYRYCISLNGLNVNYSGYFIIQNGVNIEHMGTVLFWYNYCTNLNRMKIDY